ncbi:MAG: CD1871A family CXXC motif-containing protein [Candidatus Limivicinus sp.]
MKKINTARIITILTSLAFIGYGIIREEHLTVLKKAVNICLECIGIG